MDSFGVKVKPLCTVFGKCGGCLYQDLPYSEELKIKHSNLLRDFSQQLGVSKEIFEPIVPSPEEYHYRHRLNVALRRLKNGEILFGFTSFDQKHLVDIEACPIAKKEISDFLPLLRREAIQKLPADYKNANLVIRKGEGEKIVWGGIGKKSLRLPPEDYLYAEVSGKKIFFSLETFFQANFSILPKLQEKIEEWIDWEAHPFFLDVYGGVGLFTLLLADKIQKGWILEEVPASIRLAQYNLQSHHLQKIELIEGKTEEKLEELFSKIDLERSLLMVDPPRKGLLPSVCELLEREDRLKTLLYLSCNPASLVEDLKRLTRKGWRLEKGVGLDFFPKTKHLEVLTLLKK